MKQISLTGIKPTGILHLGNYFGAIKPAIEMNKEGNYDNYYFNEEKINYYNTYCYDSGINSESGL